MPKVLRVTGNGKANRAIQNLTRGRSVASSKILPRARPFQDPGGLDDSHVRNNVESRFPGLEETTEQSARPMTPDSQAPRPRRTPRERAPSRREVSDHDAGPRWRASSQALRATP
jgi:hypothetical protein